MCVRFEIVQMLVYYNKVTQLTNLSYKLTYTHLCFGILFQENGPKILIIAETSVKQNIL